QIGGDGGESARADRAVAERDTADAVAAATAIDPAGDVRHELVAHRPAEALLRAGNEHEALALVVGATGTGPIRGALLGSVTYQVVHRSTRPVLVVPSADEPRHG
ncbi:MAG: Universal stress protein family protein, partial [Actinomycetia bacterium]|nr:Universal stress protein family protein [Actinomycetes bacterium]